ncbi:MAG: InlB B-repeat-containing protein, partial [Oscillospiraceae bacterium]
MKDTKNRQKTESAPKRNNKRGSLKSKVTLALALLLCAATVFGGIATAWANDGPRLQTTAAPSAAMAGVSANATAQRAKQTAAPAGASLAAANTAQAPQAALFAQNGPAVYRVTFYNADGSVFLTQDVANGQPASAPAATPEPPAGKTSFSGWFLDAGGNTPFDFATPITGSLDLHAVFSSQHVVSFKNEAGEVYLTQNVDDGGFASYPAPNPTSSDSGKKFQFWYIENAAETAYDFASAPVYSNITLVPKFSNSLYVFFETGGGTSVGYALVMQGSPVSAPTPPTRAGYQFSFWSREASANYTEKAGKEYNFAAPVEDTLILHAIWQPVKVAYSIVYWHEKANFAGDPGRNTANYTYSATVAVTQSQSTLVAGQALSEADVKALAEGKYSTVGNNTNKPLKYSKYKFGPAATVNGNGTTVINVYYSRMVFTLAMNLDKAAGLARIEKNGQNYYLASYTFTGKYEQQIVGRFPLDIEVITTDNTVIDGWQISGSDNVTNSTETPHSAVSMYSEWMIPKGYQNPATRTIAMKAIWMSAANARDMSRQTDVSMRNDDTAAIASSGATVVILTHNSFPCPACPDEPPEYIRYNGTVYRWDSYYAQPGYDLKSKTSAAYYNYAQYTGTTNLYNELAMNQADPATNIAANTKAGLYMLYGRTNVTLTLNAMGGTVEGAAQKTMPVLYGNVVYTALQNASGSLPEAVANSGLESFVGW